ncbi:MAG: hypothetical protein ACWGMZ_00610 [Thermoguttaceae bacterium]
MSGGAWLRWLLFVAICLSGCGKPQAAGDAESSKPPPAWRPGEKVTYKYKWPKDFKLPLTIVMEVPKPPAEIRGPSPPISENSKHPAKQPGKKFPWFF